MSMSISVILGLKLLPNAQRTDTATIIVESTNLARVKKSDPGFCQSPPPRNTTQKIASRTHFIISISRRTELEGRQKLLEEKENNEWQSKTRQKEAYNYSTNRTQRCLPGTSTGTKQKRKRDAPPPTKTNLPTSTIHAARKPRKSCLCQTSTRVNGVTTRSSGGNNTENINRGHSPEPVICVSGAT